jgi:SAM-dependent methyltransferase
LVDHFKNLFFFKRCGYASWIQKQFEGVIVQLSDPRTDNLGGATDVGSMNKELWEEFYAKHGAPSEPSSFAQYCLPMLEKGSVLFELGCGNGRDAIYFLRNQIRVWACDSADFPIRELNEKWSEHIKIPHRFFCADFTNLPVAEFARKIDCVYSRFTLHAINANAANRALKWASEVVKPDGLLMIEARSIKDPLYGRGRMVERDAFIFHHYRRFIRLNELVQQLEEMGFCIDEALESDNLAILGNDNPVLLRVRARKSI